MNWFLRVRKSLTVVSSFAQQKLSCLLDFRLGLPECFDKTETVVQEVTSLFFIMSNLPIAWRDLTTRSSNLLGVRRRRHH
jgi:hypothetical protein